MKYKKYVFLNVLFVVCFMFSGHAQMSNNSWVVQWDYPKSFIENKGQFDGRGHMQASDIIYAVDQGPVQIFFTKTGVSYYLDTKVKNKDRKKGDITKPKRLAVYDLIHMTWEGANPDVEIVAVNPQKAYHTYSMLCEDRQTYSDIRNVRGFDKIIYKNLYPGIDAEYTFHPESGIKYAFIIQQGADVSKIKMTYEDGRNISLTPDGQLKINTLYGAITEHAPVTYYAENPNSLIASSFELNNYTVQFKLDNYDATRPIVLDPWVQTPTLSNSNGVWELDKDAAGNIYIIGGDMPMKLQKYNAAGTLQWTYNTPWDTANYWLGTLTSDLNGNSYITSGSSAAIQKISTTGSMVWSANGGPMDEYWSLAFNCDYTKLIAGGTRLNPISIENSHGVIFNIDLNNGNLISLMNTTQSRTFNIAGGQSMVEPNEIRALTYLPDGRFFYHSLDTIGAISSNFDLCVSNVPIFQEASGFSFGYKSEIFRPNNGNSGIKATCASKDFIYTHKGNMIVKRDLFNGSILDSATIPGALINTLPYTGFISLHNCGIATDSCGNVYVGSADRVVKFDADLNLLSEITVPFSVFDVIITTEGHVVVCGATGQSSSTTRVGYLQSVNMGACTPAHLACCNTVICPVGPFCDTSTSVILTAETPGGYWSGPGLDSVTGEFSPLLAGVGTHTISYTLSCGSSATYITVLTCNATNTSLSSDSIYNITSNSAYCHSTVTQVGGYPVNSRGICWATTSNPTLNNAFSSDGSGLGNFTSHLTGLSSNTSYFVRAYATNSLGTTYGNELHFTTSQSSNIEASANETFILNIFPNPVSNELIIEVMSNSDFLRFDILTTLGQVVYNGFVYKKTVIPMENFTSGIYIIKFENAQTVKFVKM